MLFNFLLLLSNLFCWPLCLLGCLLRRLFDIFLSSLLLIHTLLSLLLSHIFCLFVIYGFLLLSHVLLFYMLWSVDSISCCLICCLFYHLLNFLLDCLLLDLLVALRLLLGCLLLTLAARLLTNTRLLALWNLNHLVFCLLTLWYFFFILNVLWLYLCFRLLILTLVFLLLLWAHLFCANLFCAFLFWLLRLFISLLFTLVFNLRCLLVADLFVLADCLPSLLLLRLLIHPRLVDVLSLGLLYMLELRGIRVRSFMGFSFVLFFGYWFFLGLLLLGWLVRFRSWYFTLAVMRYFRRVLRSYVLYLLLRLGCMLFLGHFLLFCVFGLWLLVWRLLMMGYLLFVALFFIILVLVLFIMLIFLFFFFLWTIV